MTLPRGFPLATLRGDQEISRIHRSARDPWWFSTDGSGRFDPVGSGSGSCYFAKEPIGAWIEVFRKQILLADDEVNQRSLYRLRLGRDLKLADITSRRALQFGVTASLGANEDYTTSHTFAAEALASGFDGIRYPRPARPRSKALRIRTLRPARQRGRDVRVVCRRHRRFDPRHSGRRGPASIRLQGATDAITRRVVRTEAQVPRRQTSRPAG